LDGEKSMTSEKFIAHYETIYRAGTRFKYFIWHRGHDSGIYDANREKLMKAEQMVRDALKLIDEVFTPEIGRMVVQETKEKNHLY
jgi:hypothetical protein